MTPHRSLFSFLRPLAFSATVALTLTGVFSSTPVFADDLSPQVDSQLTDSAANNEAAEPAVGAAHESATAPPSSADEQLFEAAGVELVGVGQNAAGDTVVVTTGGDVESTEGQEALDEFASTQNDIDDAADIITIELDSPVEALTGSEIAGGSGYIAANAVTGAASYCSLGFSAWNPTGDPAFLTAGHCKQGDELNIALASIPEDEPAVGGAGTVPSISLPLIGRFGFAQYGGPDGTTGERGSSDSIDIAVIDIDSPDTWVLKPEVTDWRTPGETLPSLAESTIGVERVGLPQVGPLTRSGRTTGYVEGVVKDTDVLNGWTRVSGRWVHGFSSQTAAIPGDSGGPVLQGTTAVGLVSGSATLSDGSPYMWASLLQESLQATGGYEVALDIAAPELMTPRVTIGENLTVSTADNATNLQISVDSAEFDLIPVNGVVTIPAPDAGVYEYTLTAQNGMSSSTTVVASATVAPPAPSITSLTDGARYAAGQGPTRITGTGIDGATVELQLIVTEDSELITSSSYSARVSNGAWEVDLGALDLDDAHIEASATQQLNNATSAAHTLKFSVEAAATPVTPPAPETPAPEAPDTPQAPAAPNTPHVPDTSAQTSTLARTGGNTTMPLTATVGAFLLLGAGVLGGAAIRRKNIATR